MTFYSRDDHTCKDNNPKIKQIEFDTGPLKRKEVWNFVVFVINRKSLQVIAFMKKI